MNNIGSLENIEIKKNDIIKWTKINFWVWISQNIIGFIAGILFMAFYSFVFGQITKNEGIKLTGATFVLFILFLIFLLSISFIFLGFNIVIFIKVRNLKHEIGEWDLNLLNENQKNNLKQFKKKLYDIETWMIIGFFVSIIIFVALWKIWELRKFRVNKINYY